MFIAHSKFLLSITMILGVILLITGGLVVNEANEALKRSIVHSSEGEIRIHVSMQKDHTYDIKIEIEATKYENGALTFTSTSAIAAFRIDESVAYERFLYDDNYDEENPRPVKDSIIHHISPISDCELTVSLHNINADTWQIIIFKDKPTNLDFMGFLGGLVFGVGIIFTIVGIANLILYLRK